MSNFLHWLVKPLPDDEVETYLNMNNICVEKADLYLDIALSLHNIIVQTYLGDFSHTPTSLEYSDEDVENHFSWVWTKLLSDFKREGIIINDDGDHKEYLKLFYIDSFYRQKMATVRESIGGFFSSIFNISAARSKADLDILKELYKMFESNITYLENFKINEENK